MWDLDPKMINSSFNKQKKTVNFKNINKKQKNK